VNSRPRSPDRAFGEPSPEAGRFADRRDAGRRLALRLGSLSVRRPLIIALPRGGVPVGIEIAGALGAPLEVFAVRKLGAPHNPEYGIGALAEDGTSLIEEEAVAALGIEERELGEIIARERTELRRRVDAYRGGRPLAGLGGKTVILVDDGVATGVTDTVALRALRRLQPRELILAVPVCAADAVPRLSAEADELICLLAPPLLRGVGQWYRDFSQLKDADVVVALAEVGGEEG
jgi:putative phosphoribosyl transferase